MKWLVTALALLIMFTSCGCWRPFYGQQYAQPAMAQPTVAPTFQPQPVVQSQPVMQSQPAVFAQPQVVAQPQAACVPCQPCPQYCVPCY